MDKIMEKFVEEILLKKEKCPCCNAKGFLKFVGKFSNIAGKIRIYKCEHCGDLSTDNCIKIEESLDGDIERIYEKRALTLSDFRFMIEYSNKEDFKNLLKLSRLVEIIINRKKEDYTKE